VRRPEQEAVDNENRLLGHFPVQRLDAEVIRDRMLLASGKLDRTQFGPAVAVAEDFVGEVSPAGNSARRSVYLQFRRTKPVSFLTAFDAPVMTVNCERRVASTTSPQSLMLMNSEFVLGQASAMGTRVKAEAMPAANEPPARQAARRAWQLAYLRDASEDELNAATQFVAAQIAELQQVKAAGDHEFAALTSLCQQLLSSNEFLYVE
jgi:hypothetical protein